MSRHGVRQLPRSGHGDSLCKHTTPGGCTWWCSYGRFVKASVVMLVIVGGFAALNVLLDKQNGVARLTDAGIALGVYAVVMLAMVAVANRRDGGDHY